MRANDHMRNSCNNWMKSEQKQTETSHERERISNEIFVFGQPEKNFKRLHIHFEFDTNQANITNLWYGSLTACPACNAAMRSVLATLDRLQVSFLSTYSMMMRLFLKLPGVLKTNENTVLRNEL